MLRRPAPTVVLAFVVLLALLIGAGAYTLTRRAPTDPLQIVNNDMLAGAGMLSNGVLTVSLVAREGDWRPAGADGPVHRVAAFAEEERPMQNPGPLLRVVQGTEIRATVRNALEVPLTMYGLGERRGLDADSVVLEPGASREFRFVASEPGLYPYAGRTEPVPTVLLRSGRDAQLNGVIAVDPAGSAGAPADRIFMISWLFGLDSTSVSGLADEGHMAINGREWPHTETLHADVGDSLHYRWVNATIAPHPMHLHGFYFRLVARGDGATYAELPVEQRRLAVTEILPPGGTMSVSWSPDRPGNWIFHCHFAGHMATMDALNQDRRHPITIAAAAQQVHLASNAAPASSAVARPGSHTQHGMSGLVLGIRVRPKGRAVSAQKLPERPMRLLLRSRPAVYGEYSGYGYVLGGSPEEREPNAFSAPGPTLVLHKDEPVALTLVNQSHEAAAVHWHGIELESFPDGVAGWSGQGRRILPMIPPGDSLTVQFTPPRAGTFMYHSHMNEFQQISSGMYGAIVVLEPGQEFNPRTDKLLIFSDGGPTVNLIDGPYPPVLLNGKAQPEPMELRAGERYRFRLINIQAEAIIDVALLDGDAPVTWRMIAKDGADLPAEQARTSPAHLHFSAGEIYDFEFTPSKSGPLTLRFGPGEEFPGAPPVVRVPVVVR